MNENRENFLIYYYLWLLLLLLLFLSWLGRRSDHVGLTADTFGRFIYLFIYFIIIISFIFILFIFIMLAASTADTHGHLVARFTDRSL
jgi:hypothetical protein